MSRSGKKITFRACFLDQTVEVNVGEAHARIGAPMAEQTPLDMLNLQRLAEEGIVSQVDHPRRHVQCRVPIGLYPLQLFGLKRRALYGRTRRAVGADGSCLGRRVHGFLRRALSGWLILPARDIVFYRYPDLEQM